MFMFSFNIRWKVPWKAVYLSVASKVEQLLHVELLERTFFHKTIHWIDMCILS